MRDHFKRFGVGVGEAVETSKAKGVVTEITNALVIDVLPGVKIVVAAESPSETPCDLAWNLTELLREQKLLRFMAFRRGSRNCHAIVGQLYLDFKALGIANRFSYKRGSSPLIANDDDPEGLHSWIERDGWAIDTAGGAVGNPIVVERVAPFYARMRLENIRDIPIADL